MGQGVEEPIAPGGFGIGTMGVLLRSPQRCDRSMTAALDQTALYYPWLPHQLEGYRLERDLYQPIVDGRSEALGLRLAVEGALIGFYRYDTGERLLIPGELAAALRREALARQQAEQRAE
jgi:hypothetical protein